MWMFVSVENRYGSKEQTAVSSTQSRFAASCRRNSNSDRWLARATCRWRKGGKKKNLTLRHHHHRRQCGHNLKLDSIINWLTGIALSVNN